MYPFLTFIYGKHANSSSLFTGESLGLSRLYQPESDKKHYSPLFPQNYWGNVLQSCGQIYWNRKEKRIGNLYQGFGGEERPKGSEADDSADRIHTELQIWEKTHSGGDTGGTDKERPVWFLSVGRQGREFSTQVIDVCISKISR